MTGLLCVITARLVDKECFMLKKVEEKLCWLFKVMIASLLAVMVVLNVLQVITRYFVAITIIWIEDVSIVCLSWMAAIAVPLLWMMKEHMIASY